MLGCIDYSKPVALHVDASAEDLGVVLCQWQADQQRIIAFASRGLSVSESWCSADKLEFLCLKWAVSENFREYLYVHQFTAHTDNKPLTYVLTTAKLDETGHRWLEELANFEFDIKYKPGKVNGGKDTLSRLPGQIPDGLTEISIPKNIAFSVCNVQSVTAVETLGVEHSIVPGISSCSMSAMTSNEWVACQKEDPDLDVLIFWSSSR